MDTQKNYPMINKELLGIVEGLQHFDNIIWRVKVRVYCDHKNLMFGTGTTHKSLQVLWQMITTS
eukprot:4338135-Ditylum_brightwellii.AAC.1